MPSGLHRLRCGLQAFRDLSVIGIVRCLSCQFMVFQFQGDDNEEFRRAVDDTVPHAAIRGFFFDKIVEEGIALLTWYSASW